MECVLTGTPVDGCLRSVETSCQLPALPKLQLPKGGVNVGFVGTSRPQLSAFIADIHWGIAAFSCLGAFCK